MATANCGMHWSWDSPMWCSGKKTDNDQKKPDSVDKKCFGCPWWKGNKKEDYD